MAYEVISQNNTTTTLSDGVNTIVIPSRVVLATSTSYTITKVNNNTATLEDGNGKIYRDIPCVAVLYGGGASGDPHNLGWYATESALTTAHPTAEAGDFAIVGSTDTVWVWDTDTSAWVDTDTKGQVQSVNNKTGTVVLDAFDVDATAQFETMPTANHGNSGKVVQYVGTTTASYTNGYFYKNVATTTPSSATASQTTGSSLTDVAVVVATFENEISTSGSYAFTSDGTDWSYDGNVVNIADYGISYTGTPVADDVITVVYTAASTTYTWTRVDVQPTPSELPSQSGNSGKFLTTDGANPSWATVGGLPSQTGQSGKFLTTNGTDASWSDKPLVNTATGTNSLSILGNPVSAIASIAIGYTSMCTANYSLALGYNCMSNGVAIGQDCNATSTYPGTAVAIGSQCNANNGVAIGGGGNMGATNGIIMCCQTHNGYYAVNTGCFNIGNANGNFEMMSANGTIPADRLPNAINKYSSMPTAASTNEGWIVQYTGTTDSTYTHGHLYECVSDGQTPATYSWTEVSMGGGSSYTAGTGIDITSNTISVINPVVLASSSSTLPSTDSAEGLAIGAGAFAGKQYGTGNYTMAIGNLAKARSDRAMAIGHEATASGFGICIGKESRSGNKGVAIGHSLTAGTSGIILGSNSGPAITGIDRAFDIVLNNVKYNLVQEGGTIPADRTSPITSISTATVTQALAANTIYNCTVDMTSIEITLPATPTANFCAQLNFTSGSTPTAFTSPVGMVWLGDDVSTTFVPVANKRYAIMVFFDGVSTRGIVQAA